MFVWCEHLANFMNSDLQIYSARWVVPVVPRNTVLQDHAVVVNNDKIVDILQSSEARAKYPEAQLTDLVDHVLLPGLINSHTHAAMTLFRGLADDIPLMSWLNDHIWPAESKWVNTQFMRDGTELAIAEMLLSGTTCFNDMYFYPDIVARTAQDMGIRALVSMIVLDFPSVWASSAEEYFNKGLDVHDEVRSLSRVNTTMAPHAPYTVSDGPLEQVRTYADELHVPIHMHVHETEHEVTEALANSGMRPLERLKQLGLLNPRMMAVHMTQLSEEEITLCAEQGINVVHCPESNLKLASGYCPVAQLIEAGTNVCLGTDSAASNNDLDMLGEMRTACLIAKTTANDASALPAWQALEMATINGAKALNIADTTGSLEIGKAADMIALNLNNISTQPVYDPISQIVYSANRSQIEHVWIDGQQRVKDGKLTGANSQQILSKARNWGEKIAETASTTATR